MRCRVRCIFAFCVSKELFSRARFLLRRNDSDRLTHAVTKGRRILTTFGQLLDNSWTTFAEIPDKFSTALGQLLGHPARQLSGQFSYYFSGQLFGWPLEQHEKTIRITFSTKYLAGQSATCVYLQRKSFLRKWRRHDDEAVAFTKKKYSVRIFTATAPIVNLREQKLAKYGSWRRR